MDHGDAGEQDVAQQKEGGKVFISGPKPQDQDLAGAEERDVTAFDPSGDLHQKPNVQSKEATWYETNGGADETKVKMLTRVGAKHSVIALHGPLAIGVRLATEGRNSGVHLHDDEKGIEPQQGLPNRMPLAPLAANQHHVNEHRGQQQEQRDEHLRWPKEPRNLWTSQFQATFWKRNCPTGESGVTQEIAPNASVSASEEKMLKVPRSVTNGSWLALELVHNPNGQIINMKQPDTTRPKDIHFKTILFLFVCFS